MTQDHDRTDEPDGSAVLDKPANGGEAALSLSLTAKVLIALPVVGVVVGACVLYALDMRTVFEPPYLLLVFNTLFLSILPFIVVGVTARGYSRSGSTVLLMLGCGSLTLGLTSILAGWLIRGGDGPNAAVTVYDVGILSVAIFHFIGAALTSMGVAPQENLKRRKRNLAAMLLGIPIISGVVATAALYGVLPRFFIQGVGSTRLDHAVVIAAITMFLVSSHLFMGLYHRGCGRFARWYGVGLLLFAAGLLCISLQKSVGSPIGWLGRSAQYLGGIYFLAAVLSAAKEVRARGVMLIDDIAILFRHRLEVLVRNRTEQLSQVNEKLRCEITERKCAEEALREGEERFRGILQSMPIGAHMYELQSDGRLCFVGANPAADRILGVDNTRYMGQSIEEAFPAIVDTEIPGRFREIARNGGHQHEGDIAYEDELIEGVFQHHNFQTSPGKMVSLFLDITERKEAEESLRKSEQQYRRIVETAYEGVWVIDAQGDTTFVNPRMAGMLGYTVEEMLGESLLSFMDERAKVEAQELLERRKQGIVEGHDFRFRRKDGTDLWAIVSTNPIFDDEGRYEGALGMITDVTERKRTEEMLREQSSFRESVIARAAEGLCVCHEIAEFPHVSFTVWNDQMTWITGYTMAEINTLGWYQTMYPDPVLQQQAVERMARMRQGDDLDAEEWTINRKDNTKRAVQISTSVLNTGDGVAHVLALMQDITQRKQAEEALRESHNQLQSAIAELKRTQEQVIRQERLHALGEMASGIGHDLNNTLTPILGYSELLWQEATLSETGRDYLKWIETGARDAAAVVARVRQFHQTGHDVETLAPVQVRELLTDAAELTRPKWRDEAQRTARNIELDLQLEDVPPVLGNPAELREVFTNLILNAVDALSKGGRITLRLRGTCEAVVIEVADTGVGMPADVRSKCFEPFFSTKGLDGTGLGLSVCHGIVERHGGRIEIDSTPGHGTTFAIHLPVALECPSNEPHEPDAPLPSGRVLLIDDDPRVHSVIGAMLNQLGQEVDVAESGAEGLEMFQANEYDVVITDLGMPDMDGNMVTRIVKTERPEMPVVMLTGWGTRPESQQSSEAPDFVLSKPVTIRQLREVLGRVQRIP